MNLSIESHDSDLAKVSFSEGHAELHFSPVCIHRSEGVPGVDRGTGSLQQAILRIYNVRTSGSLTEFPVVLTYGEVRMGSVHLKNEIPVPLHHQGPFELKLVPIWQADNGVSFAGTGADLELLGEPEFVEEVRP